MYRLFSSEVLIKTFSMYFTLQNVTVSLYKIHRYSTLPVVYAARGCRWCPRPRRSPPRGSDSTRTGPRSLTGRLRRRNQVNLGQMKANSSSSGPRRPTVDAIILKGCVLPRSVYKRETSGGAGCGGGGGRMGAVGVKADVSYLSSTVSTNPDNNNNKLGKYLIHLKMSAVKRFAAGIQSNRIDVINVTVCGRKVHHFGHHTSGLSPEALKGWLKTILFKL